MIVDDRIACCIVDRWISRIIVGKQGGIQNMRNSLRELKRSMRRIDTVQFILSSFIIAGMVILAVASIVDGVMALKEILFAW